MFVVYILHSKSFDKIYVCYTSNLEQRIKSHNELSKKGWTLKFRPWEIVHQEEFATKMEAMKREKELKSYQGRECIRRTFLG